jgi:hypothetical protein
MFSVFHHDLEGIAAERLRSLTGQLRRLQRQGAASQAIDAVCQDEVSWSQSSQGLNGCREKYQACARLLADLAKLRWRIVQEGFTIELSSPKSRKVSSKEIPAYKDTVRSELASQLRQQFSNQSVRDFIRRMEKPSPSAKKRSVFEIIADGRELRERLLAASEASGSQRATLCASAVQPYLQLVEPDAKDTFTGHSLSDVWRYFRYTWSIPATNVPGRNLFYLIRDASHPNHAVMGITALSNAPLALGDRDYSLGWNAAATHERATQLARLPDNQAAEGLASLFADLEANIQLGLESISFDQLLKPQEVDAPSEEVIARLKRRAAEFASKRQDILSASDAPLSLNELEERDYGEPGVSDDVLALEGKVFGNEKMNAARRALTAKKRAGELARLLQARVTLRQFRDRLLSQAHAPSAYGCEVVTTAVNTAWFSAKNARAGTSMLEMTVCGSVRPYNHILGGKLAALLMLSPEVADDYTRRYGSAVSIISSMMKNEPVVKDSRLVFLGTTSLYQHGASQYNRVRLPAGVISPEQTEIRYEALGETGGFGTVQFSPATVEAVEKVLMSSRGYREVNSVFGEGRSPKLRKIRAGLDALGFDADMLLQHHQPRVIFGVKLFPDADEFLRTGHGHIPDFILNPDRFRDATGRIAGYWSERWLSRRLDHAPLLDALANCPAWALSQIIPAQEPVATDDAGVLSKLEPVRAVADRPEDMRLWESLASAGHDSCSDCVSEADLDRLHVPSPLEDFLVRRAREGFSIVLTGNAGDGKTHLLRRIAPALTEANAIVDFDATAVMRKGAVTPILDRWRSALDARRPYCIAANEYPLHLLIRAGKNSLPESLHAELARQTRERFAYGPTDEKIESAKEQLLVIDLSVRNPLNPAFSLNALNRMLTDPAVAAHASSGSDSDFTWNHRMLSSQRVQERLAALFLRLAALGHRCTIRELWICLARLLFGDPSERVDGRPATGAVRSWYSTRLFTLPSSGLRFRLGKLLLDSADPAASSHPQWDARLERAAEMDASLWIDGIPAVEVTNPDQRVSVQRFAALKRRFLFEHESGSAVFALGGRSGTGFVELLAGAALPDDIFKGRLLRAINHAYCPRPFSGSDRELYLWFSHRYHEQPTRAYVASRSIPAANFTVRLPRLPSRLSGAFDYQPDHLMLECIVGGKCCRLKIDAALNAVLQQLAGGFPRHLAPERELNKLDDFLSRVQRLDVPDTRQFLIYSAEKRLATRVTLDEAFTHYSEVTVI